MPYPPKLGTALHAPIVKLKVLEAMPSQFGVAYCVTITYGTVGAGVGAGAGAGVGAITFTDPELTTEHTPITPVAI